MPPATSYTLITRAKAPQLEFMFQRLPEPCYPAGLDRATPYQFMLRLREFPPNLTDAIVVASTGSEDIGLITRSKTPLSSDLPVDQVNVFTTTAMADDSRRAQMPMTEDLQTTSPVGVAIDLSSKDTVSRPLPKEEFEESAGPLPALMILNNEGVLMTWWLVYAESIRQRTSFTGLAALGGVNVQQPLQDQRQASPFPSASQQSAPAFGQATFGQPSTSAFASTSAPSGGFNSTTSGSAFGTPGTPAAAFGATPALGSQASLWGGVSSKPPAAPAFGQPSFGSSTSLGGPTSGPTFGQTGGLARSSPWGTPHTGSAAASGSAFGQTGSLGMKSTPFGAASSAAPYGSTATTAGSPAPTSGFASFAANPSPFMAAGAAPTQSVFGKPSPGPASTSFAATNSPFNQTSKKDEAPKPAFGNESSFTLGSTFKSDGTAANDASKPAAVIGGSIFGSNFGDALGKAQTEETQTKDADMDDNSEEVPDNKFKEQAPPEDTVEVSKQSEAPNLASQVPRTAPPKFGGLFGTQSQSEVSPAEMESSKPAPTWSFGKMTADSIAPREIHVKGKDLPAVQMSPKIKAEPEDSEDEKLPPLRDEVGNAAAQESTTQNRSRPEGSSTPDPPLPPESTSKASFAPGDSSNSSKSSNEEPADPPLPPDPFPTKSKLSNVESVSAEPPLSPDPFPSKGKPTETDLAHPEQPKLRDEDEDGALDDEGSGVDVAQEFSSPSDRTQSPKISPENSVSFSKSSVGGLFSKTSPRQAAPKGPSLFGEVDKTSGTFGKPLAPFFPPPTKTPHSPRSPSPVRQTQLSTDSLRPENSRSISAPGPFNAVANRKAAMKQLAVPSKQTQPSNVEFRKQQEGRFAIERAKQAAEEEQSLSDDEDEQVRRELETPVAGSRFLDPFLAHQDYVGHIDKPGIPGQIEKVYRDINSMIDTLGLNARSLTAFVKGHSEQIDEGEISTEDLEHADDFALDEVPKLVALETQLSGELDSHRLQDVQENLFICRDIRKDIQSLRHKRNDMTKAIESRNDPEIVESALSAPLSLEQASQQHDVRKKFAHFQKLLAQAEEDITMLRAKLAACDSSRLGSSMELPLQKKPTVEAVTKTILKMTNMIEKKSGDIDVLEAQLRNLRLPSVEAEQGGNREDSPFVTSRSKKGSAIKGSPAGRKLQSGAASLGSSPLRRSLNGDGSPKKGPDGLINEDVQQYRLKAQRRKEINVLVRQAFEKSGPRLSPLD